jgi:hypothetical protein
MIALSLVLTTRRFSFHGDLKEVSELSLDVQSLDEITGQPCMLVVFIRRILALFRTLTEAHRRISTKENRRRGPAKNVQR